MQAQELFPQVQKLPLSESMAPLSYWVQIIQREVGNAEPRQTVLEQQRIRDDMTLGNMELRS